MTDLLITAHDIVLLGNRSLSVWVPGNEIGVGHLEQTFTGHAMKSGSCLLALKLIVEYQRYQVTHTNLLPRQLPANTSPGRWPGGSTIVLNVLLHGFTPAPNRSVSHHRMVL